MLRRGGINRVGYSSLLSRRLRGSFCLSTDRQVAQTVFGYTSYTVIISIKSRTMARFFSSLGLLITVCALVPSLTPLVYMYVPPVILCVKVAVADVSFINPSTALHWENMSAGGWSDGTLKVPLL